MKTLVSGAWLVVSGLALGAANDSFLIRNADVYPVSSAPQMNVSVLVQDGKIADIGAKIVPPKGIRIVEGKGLRVYPGMIDSETNIGLSEVSGERVTVDTGEIGEFMPQLRALIAVNPESEFIPVTRVNGITSVMTFPAVERLSPGDMLNRARCNLDGAIAKLTPEQPQEADDRARKFRESLKATGH